MTIEQTITWSTIILIIAIIGSVIGIVIIQHFAGDRRDVHLGQSFFATIVAIFSLIIIIFLWTSYSVEDRRQCYTEVAAELEFNSDIVTAVTRDDLLSSICA